MAFFASSSSSSCSSLSCPWRYDVFINFRGEDTRRGFSRNLYEALRRKALSTFFDDDELERGEEISKSLVQAIQKSNVAVVVFSKDYASSTWCLDELVKIDECRESRGQIVIPIFYDVNPSHIRKQTDDVATAFEGHEQNPRNAHKIKKWREALTNIANLSGFDSRYLKYDYMLISGIVEDISAKLKKFDVDERLVGVDSHFMQIKNGILSVEELDVCIIGIWGMGGIGKTTIAEFIFKRLSFGFEGCCFLKDVRERSEVKDLRKELISQLLGKKDRNVCAFPQARLDGGALIVLDDVDDWQQFDSLIGDPRRFGSRIVIFITVRDKQVIVPLIQRWAGFLYKVEPLRDEEALQLFSRSAFNQNYPRNDYESLSSSIVKYAHGNPLALKVLGSSLCGKTTEVWESALIKLSKGPEKKIQDVLRISYNGLDETQKDIFLHIACFFKGEEKDVVQSVLKNCEYDISVLVDKCFVTISADTFEMHDLMQEMGKEIVRQESDNPNERSRLWDPKDVFKVIAQEKEAEAVKSIVLDLSIREIDLNPKVFMKIPNLKFLKFYVPNRYACFEEQNKLRLPQGLDYLPNKLTYFHWDGYPLESLPRDFRPKHLIVLGLPNSKIKRFQEEVRDENMGYLLASQLKFGTVLHHFCSLIKIPTYIYGWQLGKVTSLSLASCKNISHLPSSGVGLLEAVEKLILYGCENLNTFPKVSRKIKYMDLSMTAIKQIPSSSVECLGQLEELIMYNCDKLESLPSNFFDALTSLRKLWLTCCWSLKKLPEISKNMYSLKGLWLSGRDLEIPSSIGNLKGLKRLYIRDCSKLTFVRKSVINLEGASSLQHLCLQSLNLRELPKNLSYLSSLTYLNLNGNHFERIPAAIKQLSSLKKINISCCQRLISLPEFPLSLTELQAHHCTSLEQIRSLKQLALESESTSRTFCLWDCLKLDEDECQDVANQRLEFRKTWVPYHMCYPGSRIPKWVKYQNMGDSVEFPIPSHRLNRCTIVALYVCVRSTEKSICVGDVPIKYNCYFGNTYHTTHKSLCGMFTFCYNSYQDAHKEHMLVEFCPIVLQSYSDVVLFKFSSLVGFLEILKCGVNPFFLENEFPTPMSTVKKEEVEEAVVAGSKVRKRKKKTACGQLSICNKKEKK